MSLQPIEGGENIGKLGAAQGNDWVCHDFGDRDFSQWSPFGTEAHHIPFGKDAQQMVFLDY
jgi:hypothetical protein